jgi:hypothetical protein
MRIQVLLLLLAAVFSHRASAQLIDGCENLGGWNAVPTHGSTVTISLDQGKTGNAMKLEYRFLGLMGSVAAQKKFGIALPADYMITFDLRADSPVNNFEFRLLDSLGNVWWSNRLNMNFPRSWTRIRLKKPYFSYAWGPSWGGDIRFLDRIELVVSVATGGKGTLWIDNLTLEAIDDSAAAATTPTLSWSSLGRGGRPLMSRNAGVLAGWHSAGIRKTEWLTVDFHRDPNAGGLSIDWDREDYATTYDVMTSTEGGSWSTAYSVTRGNGGRDYIPLYDMVGTRIRIVMRKSSSRRGYGIDRLEFRDPGFSLSANEFFRTIAREAPRGFYPRYFIPAMSFWTTIGAPADTKEALINEQGTIETDKMSFSLEPFLFVDDALITWNDVVTRPSLQDGYLPIPSVTWDYRGRLRLRVTGVAAGEAGASTLVVRYTVENTSPRALRGKLFVALRPFQVDPPWQIFTMVGGVARIDSVRCGDVLRVNTAWCVPVTSPQGAGAAEFDQGDVTEYVRRGVVPPSRVVRDHTGHASAALAYAIDLAPGAHRDVIVTVPFHGAPAGVPVRVSDPAGTAYFDSVAGACASLWHAKLDAVDIRVPASAQAIMHTVKSNLAYIAINADGPGVQPGSRSYERSWIRDGSMTCAALLQMGVTDEVRAYADWYAAYQYPDGMIPCIVDDRGPDPVPEHDSHGQFIYLIKQYFDFTRDTTWLRGKWEHVVRAVRYMQRLRASRKTGPYISGTAEQRACYGLLPASISHEGYSAKAMHSYWDDFFALRGFKDASAIAAILGDRDLANEFGAERDDFRKDLYASLASVIREKNLEYLPGCVELGDEGGLSTTIALTPVEELGHLPEPQTRQSFDRFYADFVARKNNTSPWWAYLPYEARFIGSFVYLDQKERAWELLEYLMNDRRPADWNHWAECVWKDRDTPRNIGDMPHTWAGSDFIRSVRSMFVYEREIDDALIVGAGIPEAWVDDPAGVIVRNLPTTYGRLSYEMRSTGTDVFITLSGDVSIPRGKIVVKAPRIALPVGVSGDCTRGTGPHDIIVSRLPSRVVIHYEPAQE